MKIFGYKEVFAIEYELKESPFAEGKNTDPSWGKFHMWVHNKSVCTFLRNGIIREYEWDLIFIVEWLYKNLNNIFNETQFPLPVEGNNSIEFYNNSGDFDSDDDELFSWFEKRQDWYFRHGWFSNNGGSFLADMIFRKVDNTVEIAWDNSDSFSEVKFINPSGVYYVPVELFESVTNGFIEDFILEVSKSEEGRRLLQTQEEDN